MPRSLLLTAILSVSALLTGCGLAGTSVAGGTTATLEVEQARQAKETEARVQKQVDAAVQQNTDHQKAAETEAQ